MSKYRFGKFVRPQELTEQEKRDIPFGMNLSALLWRAAEETGTFDLEEVRRRGCCLLASMALADVFRALSRQDVTLLRCGINLTTWRGSEPVSSTTVGHPAAPAASNMWNAHSIVRMSDRQLWDPTIGQMLPPGDNALHFAVLMREQPTAFHLHDHGDVDVIASSSWQNGERRHEVRYFRLPREVDIATRKWRHTPDAQPQRREALVRRTLELFAQEIVLQATGGSISAPGLRLNPDYALPGVA